MKSKLEGSASHGLSAHFPPVPVSAAGTIPCWVTQPAPSVPRQMGGKTLLAPRFSWINIASNAVARLRSQKPSLDKTPKHSRFPAWPLRAAGQAHPQPHGSHLSPSKCGRCWVLVPCVVVSGISGISSAPGNGMFAGEALGPGAALGLSGMGAKRGCTQHGESMVCERMLHGWQGLLATRQYLPARQIAFVSQRKQKIDIIPSAPPTPRPRGSFEWACEAAGKVGQTDGSAAAPRHPAPC